MPNEKQTDFIIVELLKNAGINFFPNGSNVVEIQNALSTASKRGTNKKGFPEFTAVVNDFVIVIEDKADSKFQANYLDKNTLLMDTESITKYAENGALHYALNIIAKTNFKKIIAFGCSGTDAKKILIRPIFVSPTGYRILDKVKDFFQFSSQNIAKYYREIICQNESLEKVELKDILNRAENLHENLRNYGQLGDTEKPLVVSAILLALAERDFSTENLTGDEIKTDGKKIFESLSTHMDRVEVSPQTKKSKVLDQFRLIVNRPHLSNVNKNLGKSPLKFFAEYLNSNILTAIVNNSPEDVLGRFYGEFIRYSGGDGQTLGVVLTPKHITELFCDLAKIKPTDKIFDPCCGTGGFLIAAMNKMLELARTDDEKIFIKKNLLHGIELRDDMFSIATTNMILRGDGKSNLLCDDFLNFPVEKLREKNFSVGFMNPPYSQAKNKSTTHLSELKFISKLLDSLGENARCVVIVPQSTMVGKTSEDKSDKKYILENHTLEGVITLNPQTFYGVGTNPVIAVFTAHKPHDTEKLVKFVDFKNDGYEIFPHIGLLATPDAPERKKFLLQCWHEGKTAPNSFIIRTEIKPEDEWLHSFYYFNDEIPAESDFEKTMADYLTFEFNMIVHGRGYLFDDEKKNFVIEKNLPPLESKTWKDFCIEDLFDVKIGKNVDGNKIDRSSGQYSYITRKENNNGLDGFIDYDEEFLNLKFPVITIGNETAKPYVQVFPFFTGTKVNILSPKKFLSRWILQFIAQSIQTHKKNFSYSFTINSTRLKNLSIKLPVNELGEPDYFFMENYMWRIEEKLLQLYKNYIERQLENNFVLTTEKKVWKDFLIKDIFDIKATKSGIDKSKLKIGDEKFPYVTRSDKNNGWDSFTCEQISQFDNKNVLTIGLDTQTVFYQPTNFYTGQNIQIFSSNFLNKYVAMFISPLLKIQMQKFNWGGNGATLSRLKALKINLPVDESGEPDWEYMEKFMRAKENELLKKYFDKKFAEKYNQFES